jgi:hypothetical protein
MSDDANDDEYIAWDDAYFNDDGVAPFETIFQHLYVGKRYANTPSGIPKMMKEHVESYTLWVDGGGVFSDFALVDVDDWDAVDGPVKLINVRTVLNDLSWKIEELTRYVSGQEVRLRVLEQRLSEFEPFPSYEEQ